MSMELDVGPSARAFRDEVRGWLEANRPEELMGVDAERLACSACPVPTTGPESCTRPA
jgi:hypothetical protein